MVKGSKHTERTRQKLSEAAQRRKVLSPHGTNNRYVNGDRCRCEFCTKARRSYMLYRAEEKRLVAEAAAS